MQFILTGSNVQATFSEPTQNEPNDAGDLTPLTDLGKTTIKFQVNGADVTVAKEVPATAPTGGGAVDETIVVPALSLKQASVDFWATATDQGGNESGPSPKTTLSIDNLAPLPPQ